MAFTPSSTAFGLDDNYVGVLAQSGAKIIALGAYEAHFDYKGADAELPGAMLLLRCYTPDWSEAGRQGALFDGIWFATAEQIDQECTFANAAVKQEVDAALTNAEDVVLCVGLWQTVDMSILGDPLEIIFDGDATPLPPAKFRHCKGVVVANSKSRIQTFEANVRTHEALFLLLDDDMRARLHDEGGPAPPLVKAFPKSTDPHRAIIPFSPSAIVSTEDGNVHAGSGPAPFDRVYSVASRIASLLLHQ